MKSSSLKCKKNTVNIDPKVLSSNNSRVIILSKGARCDSKK